MSAKQREFALQWLEKASHDLFVVEHMLAIAGSPGDMIAFHCQQAIEKSLKSLLTAHGIRFARTHDLEELIDLCIPILPALKAWRERCAMCPVQKLITP